MKVIKNGPGDKLTGLLFFIPGALKTIFYLYYLPLYPIENCLLEKYPPRIKTRLKSPLNDLVVYVNVKCYILLCNTQYTTGNKKHI